MHQVRDIVAEIDCNHIVERRAESIHEHRAGIGGGPIPPHGIRGIGDARVERFARSFKRGKSVVPGDYPPAVRNPDTIDKIIVGRRGLDQIGDSERGIRLARGADLQNQIDRVTEQVGNGDIDRRDMVARRGIGSETVVRKDDIGQRAEGSRTTALVTGTVSVTATWIAICEPPCSTEPGAE